MALCTDGGKGVVSMAIPVEGEEDLYVVGLGNTISAIRWSPSDPDVHTVKPTVLHATNDFQFNDAKCDPRGRLWTGGWTGLEGGFGQVGGRGCERAEVPTQTHIHAQESHGFSASIH